jgi:hypothetical protein
VRPRIQPVPLEKAQESPGLVGSRSRGLRELPGCLLDHVVVHIALGETNELGLEPDLGLLESLLGEELRRDLRGLACRGEDAEQDEQPMAIGVRFVQTRQIAREPAARRSAPGEPVSSADAIEDIGPGSAVVFVEV